MVGQGNGLKLVSGIDWMLGKKNLLEWAVKLLQLEEAAHVSGRITTPGSI